MKMGMKLKAESGLAFSIVKKLFPSVPSGLSPLFGLKKAKKQLNEKIDSETIVVFELN